MANNACSTLELFETLPFGLIRAPLDEQAPILMANRVAVRMLGYESVAQFLRLRPSDLFDDDAGRTSLMDELREMGFVAGQEVRLRRRDGSTFWASVQASAVRGPCDRVLYLDAALMDITGHKAREDAIGRSEERFRMMAEIGRDIAFCLGPDGRIIYVSPQVAQYGFAATHLVGRSGIELIHPDDRARVRRDVETALLLGGDLKVEFRCLTPSRRVVHIESFGQAQLGPDGRVLSVSGVLRNVTDRKLAEASLTRTVARLRQMESIVNRSPAVAIRWGIEAGCWPVEFVSDNVRQFGYTPEELLSGRVNWSAITHADDLPRMRHEAMGYHRAGIDEYLQEYRLIDAAGQVHWVEDHTKVLRNDHGEVTHYEGLLIDITPRRKAQDDLLAARRKATMAREQERRRLARDLHDGVGQCITAMHMSLETLRRQVAGALAPAVGDELARLSGHCGELIGEIRRMSYGLFPVTLEQFGLAAALRLLADRAAGGATVEASCPGLGRDDRFDGEVEIALFRIAQEALSNALRHGRCGHVTMVLAHANDRLTLSVTDDGRGFNVAGGEGHGMGLASMRDRVESLGGRLVIRSWPGRTAVRAELPATPIAQSRPVAAAEVEVQNA